MQAHAHTHARACLDMAAAAARHGACGMRHDASSVVIIGVIC